MLQTVSGRRRQAMFVWLHLIGHALVYAVQLIGLRMFIDGVVKVRMLCGKQHFRKHLQLKVLATAPTDYKTSASSVQLC